MMLSQNNLTGEILKEQLQPGAREELLKVSYGMQYVEFDGYYSDKLLLYPQFTSADFVKNDTVKNKHIEEISKEELKSEELERIWNKNNEGCSGYYSDK